MIFDISGTKRTVRNRRGVRIIEVSVRRGLTVQLFVQCQALSNP